MKLEQELSVTKQSAMKTLHTAFGLLIKNNGQMQRKDLIDELTRTVRFETFRIS